MRTALILTGFFRTFDKVKDSLLHHIIQPLNCDVFFHAPKTFYAPTEHEVPELHHVYSQNNKRIDAEVFKFFGNNLKAISLRDYESANYRKIASDFHLSERNMFNQTHWRIFSHMDGIASSVSLFKNYVENRKIHYDLVILTRPDIKYYTNLNVGALNMNVINYPLHSKVGDNINTVGANASPSLQRPFNDQFLAGSQNNILVFHNIYEKVLDYTKEGVIVNPETLQGVHCLRNNVNFGPSDCVLYELWRFE